ncbi:membrane transporter [Oryctes borbonicus]|uniref:Membrane transporter n=1 Tax=Oryctes borbonicus TaxID=1629725 RepID=A0A0T6AZA3_9SCAR|nr:membrane transporter [Oryctes borbonicus]
MVATKLVPPNGGYGWIVAGAFSLHHMIVVPLAHSFGLVFKDKFKQKGFSATDITFIVNTNAASTFWCGLLSGALLKQFGYRKVSFLGAVLMTVGIFLTAYAESFTEYMIFYGVIAAIGMGMGTSAYPFALNTYFTTKRGKAFGYAMTVSGCGAALLPQLVSLLLSIYAEKGTVIILSGIASHAFISAALLQPVKRHMKEKIDEEEKGDAADDDNLLTKDQAEHLYPSNDNATKQLVDATKFGSAYSLHSLHSGSVLSLHTESQPRSPSVSCRRNNTQDRKLDRSETLTRLNEKSDDTYLENEKQNALPKNENSNSKSIVANKENKKDSLVSKIIKYIINLFDLELLKDLTFVNIIVGISLGVCSEKSFTLLIAFIMQDYGLSTQQIATFMSVLSITDICFRFVAPYVSDFFKKPVRIMYMWSVLLLIIFRCGKLNKLMFKF